MRLLRLIALLILAPTAYAQEALKPFEKGFVVEFGDCSVSRLEMGSGQFSTVSGAPVALLCEVGEQRALSCILQAAGGMPVNVRLNGGRTTSQAIVRSDDGTFQTIVNLATGVAILRSDFDVHGLDLRGVKTCSGRYLEEGQKAAPPPKPQTPERPKRIV